MSAYLSSSDTLSALTTYWGIRSDQNHNTQEQCLIRAFAASTAAATGGYNVQTYGLATATVQKLLKDSTASRIVYGLLLLENQNSLAARYPDSPGMQQANGYWFQRSQAVSTWCAQGKTGHLVGMVKGYAYQACEHDGWEQSPAYFICRQIEDHLLRDLESRDCGESRNWASFTEPVSDYPAPVCLSELLRV